MTEATKALSGKRIGILGKGGAGKTTVVVLLAAALADGGYDVGVLDADSTNVGLHQAMGLDAAPVPLLDYFGGAVFSGGAVTCPVDDPTLLPGADLFLDELPRTYYAQNRRGIVLLAAGKIGGQGPGAGCDGPVAKIARDVRIHRHVPHGVTVVDFKAGIEDSARGVLTGIDWAVVVVDPTNAAIQIARDMRRLVDQIRAGVPPATEHLEEPQLVAQARRVFRDAKIKGMMCVLNRVRDAEMESYMRRRLAEHHLTPIGVIHEDPAIAAAWLAGTPLEATVTRNDVARLVSALEATAVAAATA